MWSIEKVEFCRRWCIHNAHISATTKNVTIILVSKLCTERGKKRLVAELWQCERCFKESCNFVSVFNKHSYLQYWNELDRNFNDFYGFLTGI